MIGVEVEGNVGRVFAYFERLEPTLRLMLPPDLLVAELYDGLEPLELVVGLEYGLESFCVIELCVGKRD